jgi:hypothetical protein
MIALARLVIIGLIVLTVIYFSLSVYSRSVRRGKLKAEWDREGMTGDRDTFIREGMEAYENSLRAKLIWGVYVVPIVLVAVIIYLTNFY